MKKCNFLSPEILLQAEIFGSSNGEGSNIIDVSDQFGVGSSIGSAQVTWTIQAYWDNIDYSGIFLAQIMPNNDNPIYITTSSEGLIAVTNQFLSNNVSAIFDDTDFPMIYFNEVDTGGGIIVCGMLTENSRQFNAI